MKDEIIEARKRVLASRKWGQSPETAIRTGQWDRGELVQNALAEVRAERQPGTHSDVE